VTELIVAIPNGLGALKTPVGCQHSVTVASTLRLGELSTEEEFKSI